jgi:drug/metabolite transporter (DMT)-like permease
MNVAVLTAGAIVAFAANSVLCRIALRPGLIDPVSFLSIRLVSGAAILLLATRLTARSTPGPRATRGGSWLAAGVLMLYGVPFSFAYNGLGAAMGALILFGCVQLTMLVAALRAGERPSPLQWLGLGLALGGLVYLVLPGIAAPPLASAALMAVAGVGWGFYSLLGRGARDPLAQTTGAFVRCVPLTLALSLLLASRAHARWEGVALAVASGAGASGLGYVVWYAALRGLTTTRAAVVQLSVPIVAALGGVLFLAERISGRLLLASVLVLGGIALTIVTRAPTIAPRPAPALDRPASRP